MASTRSTANTVTESEDDAWETCSDDSQPEAATLSSSARMRMVRKRLGIKQKWISDTPRTIEPECVRFKEILNENPDLDFGFVIYRCTYDSQEKWDRFMSHLNVQTFLNLEFDGAEELFSRIDWCVQEDEEGLKNASPGKVRRRFKDWLKEHGELRGEWARYYACVMVDKYNLNSVLTGPPPEKFDVDGLGCVTLVSLSRNDGHCLVGASYLVPRIFSLLEVGWDSFAPQEAYEVACP